MPVPYKHLVHQGKTLATLGDVLYLGLRQQLGIAVKPGPDDGALPGPTHEAIVRPRPAALIRDYLRHVGGTPSAYAGVVPPHLFPQWSFPVAEKTQRTVEYPLFKMVNGGCRLEIHGQLPADKALKVAARLESIDDNGQRAVLHQRIATGTASDPEIVVAHVHEIVRLGGGKNGAEKKAKKTPNRVPNDAREIGEWRLRREDGLTFALLTGDFNPVHWVPAYARSFGFRSTILHGFATMARAIEGLNRAVFSGDATQIRVFDARFTKPLVLPARVGLYIKDRDVWVGDAPGGPAYLGGSFTARGDLSEESRG